MARLAFFVGKGGVGKTTVSSAYAVHEAVTSSRKSVILISSDPAHSLGDIFQRKFGDDPTPVPLGRRRRLHVWQVNAEREFRDFLDKHKEEILAIIETGSSIFTRDDIEPLLNTTLPGMAEVSALLAIHDALRSDKYDSVVVDTAPFGHTLRLFEMPEHFLRFLDFLEVAASRDRVLAAHFGGKASRVGTELLSEWQAMGNDVLQAFAREARLILVSTPEKFALNESLRCRDILQSYSPPLVITDVVLNRIVTATKCTACSQRHRAATAARKWLEREFPDARIYSANDSGTPVLGIRDLQAFGDHVFSKKRLQLKAVAPKSKEVTLVRSGWPLLENPLSLVTGKGGVGKTTVSAALAFHTRGAKNRSRVEICSVDPAPSLGDIFLQPIGEEAREVLGDTNLRAREMDSLRLFKNWAAEMKAMLDQSLTSERSQIHVDLWFERELFAKLLDVVPPGVDEVFAVFRIVDLLTDQSKRVVIDMAPTGHALELLRTPERVLAWTRLLLKTLAEHRTLAFVQEVAVKVAELGQRVRELRDTLKDVARARIYTVMLAESLPDRETERLLTQLHQLGLPVGAVFINRVLFLEDVKGCDRCERSRRWQLATLARWKRRSVGTDAFVIRNFPAEIAGKRALLSFTRQLWRLS